MSLFLPLLAEATAPAAGEAAPSAIDRIVGDFGLNWPAFLAQLLSFTVVAILLWKFAFKPVLVTITARREKIASGIEYAEQMKAQLAATQTQTEAALRAAQQQAQAIVAEAQRVAKEFSEKQQREAIEQSAHLLAKAQEAIELEKKKMLADTRREIARLVVATTERVLATQIPDSERSRYNEAAARELTTV